MRVVTYKTRKGTIVPKKKLIIYDKKCEGPVRSKACVGDIVKIAKKGYTTPVPKSLRGAKTLKVVRIETREKVEFPGFKFRDTTYVLQNPKTGKTAKILPYYFDVVESKCRRKNK